MHIPGTPHTEYVYVDKEPDYKNCPHCKKKDELYKKWYSDSYSNNPDPATYSVIDHKEFGNYLVLKVSYDNITDGKFEKIKIMVLKAKPMDLVKSKALDPHFAKDGMVVARFAPTAEGWSDALAFASLKATGVRTRARRDINDQLPPVD